MEGFFFFFQSIFLNNALWDAYIYLFKLKGHKASYITIKKNFFFFFFLLTQRPLLRVNLL